MNRQSIICEEATIRQFLNCELGFVEQSLFEEHLDQCDYCCDRLEKMTAAPAQWKNVANQLAAAPDLAATDWTPANQEREDRPPIALDFLGPTDDPQMLGRFAGYEIAGVIGVGGMGIVLKGFDRSLNRFVAIKALLPMYASSAAARKRFAREARAAAAVVHENVIAIHGVSVEGTDSGSLSNSTENCYSGSHQAAAPYLVMPYIRGESLQKRLNRCGSLATEEVLRISMQVASGLAAAHQQGLVHRDIKPANILLPAGVDRVILTDFGLARAADDASLTRTGVIAGTPQYMSPEQAIGNAVTTQSDLFSLGSVMYAMCTGRVPFRASSPLAVLRRIIDETPRPIREVNPEAPAWLCQIVSRLHAKTLADRPRCAEEVAELLKECLAHFQQPDAVLLPNGATQSSPKPSTTAAFSKPQFSKGILMIGLISLALLGILLTQSAVLPTQTDKPASTEAPQDPNSIGATTKTSDGTKQAYEKKFTLSFADPSKIGELIVDINRGNITVESYEGKAVEVALSVPNYESASGQESRDGLRSLRGSAPDFDITQSGNRIKIDSSDYQFISNLEIKVPKHINLSLDSYRNGEIRVVGVSGELNIHTQNNDVFLTNVSGSAKAWSYNGSFQASFDSVTEGKPLCFESYNGSINLSLPGDYQANTKLRTLTGKLLTNFEIELQELPPIKQTKAGGDVTIKLSEFVHGKINGGGPLLTLETEKGDIRIRKRTVNRNSMETKK